MKKKSKRSDFIDLTYIEEQFNSGENFSKRQVPISVKKYFWTKGTWEMKGKNQCFKTDLVSNSMYVNESKTCSAKEKLLKQLRMIVGYFLFYQMFLFSS